MSNIVGLITNEHMKLFRRLSTWVMVIILAGVTLLAGLIIKLNTSKVDENWKENLAAQTETFKADLDSPFFPKAARDEISREILMNEYRIANDLPPEQLGSFWGFMDFSSNLVQLIILFTIIIGAGSVASEFSWGTIKLLLIRPANRAKVLLSKYLTTLMYSVYFLVALFIISFLIGMIFFGVDMIDQPSLVFEDGQVVEKSMVLKVLSAYGLNCVSLIMLVTMAFMISTVFRSSAMAIGITMFLMFVGSNVIYLLASYDWAKYIVFAHFDLTQHLRGAPLFEGTTMTFSIIVLTVYFIIFNLFSWLVFTKRDVSA